MIFWVVLGHYTWAKHIKYEPSLIWNIMGIITLFHMLFFYTVSDILYKERNIRETIKKGWQQLLTPYFVMSLSCIFIMSVFNMINGNFNAIATLKIFFAILTGGDFHYSDPYSGPLWFCYSLFLIKFFESIVSSFKYKKLIRHILIILGIIVLFKGNILHLRLDSSLVGYIFILIGFSCKEKINSIICCVDNTTQKIKTVLFAIIAFMLLFFSAYLNLDFYFKPHLSINSCIFGKYPLLFIVGGLSGTWLCLVISKIVSLIFPHSKLEVKKGLLRKMVSGGWQGKKVGKCFYIYK